MLQYEKQRSFIRIYSSKSSSTYIREVNLNFPEFPLIYLCMFIGMSLQDRPYQQTNCRLYLLMEQRKQLDDFSLSTKLPFIENKLESKNYSPKLRNKIRKAFSNNPGESERIKAQYIKLCKQIKLAYGIMSKQTNESMKSNKSKDINRGQAQTQSNKLIIQQSNNEKSMPNVKKSITQPSQFQFVYNHPHHQILSVIQQLQVNGRNVKKSIYTHFAQKQGKKMRPMGNFLIERLETDYLNVEKIRIERKYQDCPNQLKSQYLTSPGKHAVRKQQNAESEEEISLVQREANKSTILPVIKSLSKDKNLNQSNESNILVISGNNKYKNGNGASNLISNYQKPAFCKSVTVRKPKLNSKPIKNIKPFNPSFETYYYRDLLWKSNYSNEMIIEPPLQYEHRLRIYIGKGNNAGLVRGLIKRRIWFAVTERIEDANVVWTQIKHLPYFNLQSCINGKNEKETQIQQSPQNKNEQPNKIFEEGILTEAELTVFKSYFSLNRNSEERCDERLMHRNKYFISKYSTDNKSNKAIEQAEKQKQKPQQQIKQDSQQRKEELAEWKLEGKEKEKEANENKNEKRVSIRTVIKNVAEIKEQKMQNHLINNYVIGNKKALLKTMSLYYKKIDEYVFNYLPYTFHIEKGLEDENYFRFLRYYNQRGKQLKANGDQQNVWIVKPGEFSNRGHGIKVCKTLDEVKSIIKTKERNYDGSERTYIVQAYIEKPLLYNKRKFDLRHYMMITCVNGILKGYWYRQGYVRTSSSEFTLSTKDGSVHLTNDAVQKMLPEYGKYEKGNKISYEQLHNYLSRLYGYKNFNFKDIILPKMKKITRDIVRACSGSIDPQLHSNNFEIFGMDFMIDADFNLWLIEVNTNPCLQLSCPLLASIIPKMVQNALELTVDSIFPPPIRYTPKGVHYLKKLEEENKFDLIYDSRIDGIYKQSQGAIDAKLLNEEQQTYEDEGEEWNEDD